MILKKNEINIIRDKHPSSFRKASLLIIAMVMASTIICCKGNADQNEDKAIARVYDTYLYSSDLQKVIQSNINASDSADVVQYYVESWIKDRILLEKAKEAATSAKNETIEKQVENYRNTLLVHTYEQNLLDNSGDTIVKLAEVKAYYEQFQNNFELKNHQIKARFMAINLDAPQQETAQKWFQNPTTNNTNKLEDYCFQYAANFSLTSQWFDFSDFKQEIPLSTNNSAAFLKQNTFYETADDTNNYYVSIEDYGLKGSTAPLDLKKTDIVKIIINKRKLTYIKKIKNKIFKEARRNNDFEILSK